MTEFRRSIALHAALALVVCVPGCRDNVSSSRVSQVADADALWGGGGFCARTTKGLTCWNNDESTVVREGPTIVQGLEGVRDVAMRNGEACALHNKGVSCFRPGESASRLLLFDHPTRIVATGGYPGILCVLDAAGVSCWGGEVRAPALQPELGTPRDLFVSSDGGVVCGILGDGPRCFEVGINGTLGKGIQLRGVKELKGLMLSTIGGHAYVLDGTTAKHGTFQGTLSVGNPFAARNPLDVDVKVEPFRGAIVAPEQIPGLGPIAAMANWSIWPILLDDQGIAQVDAHAGTFDIKRWPGKPVSHVWSGFKDVFYTREGDALHERGREKGKQFDRVVDGVSKPVRVVADVYFACVLEEGGGVACVRRGNW